LKKQLRTTGPERLPSRIEAAFGALRHLAIVENSTAERQSHLGKQPAVSLDPPEKALKNCALETLRNYITGEDSCGESTSPMSTHETCEGNWDGK
jgi:hypothetical protein